MCDELGISRTFAVFFFRIVFEYANDANNGGYKDEGGANPRRNTKYFQYECNGNAQAASHKEPFLSNIFHGATFYSFTPQAQPTVFTSTHGHNGNTGTRGTVMFS